MEQLLQPPPLTSKPLIVLSDNDRITRGLNISIKYLGLMPKNRREEVQREIVQEVSESSVIETKVLLYLYLFSKRSSF